MLTFETKTGDPIVACGVRLVPIARSMSVTLGRFGLAWTRAAGMTVRSGDGETIVPIRDRTRRLQLAVLGAGLLASLLLTIGGRRKTR